MDRSRDLYTSALWRARGCREGHVKVLMAFNKIRFSASTRRAKQGQRACIYTAYRLCVPPPSLRLCAHLALALVLCSPSVQTPLLSYHPQQWPPSPLPLPARLPLLPPRRRLRRLPPRAAPRPRRRLPRLPQAAQVVRARRRSAGRVARRPTLLTFTRVRVLNWKMMDLRLIRSRDSSAQAGTP